MNLSDDLLNLLFGMTLLIPLSYVLRFLKPATKHLYSFVLSSALQIYVFRSGMYPIYIQHIIVFAIIKLKGPKCGLLVTVESILFLSGYHIHQIMTNYGGWTMNASALLMILACKYSLLGYNLEDGAISDPKEVEKLNAEQKRFRITPAEISFTDFIGYCNFLPSALVGPPLEYQDYKQFMEAEQVYKSIPTPELNQKLLKAIGQTLVTGLIYVFAQMFFPLSGLRQNSFYDNNSILYVLFYVLVSCTLVRFKYYFGWKLSMCAIHSSGVSYSGTDFSRVNSANVIEVQTSIHVRQKINNWNIHVQKWLNRSIYQRHDFKSKSKNQLFVFVISAFWHGFYGAYYISFVLWFIQLYLQGLVFNYFKNQNSKIVQLYKKSGKIGFFLLSLAVNFLFTQSGAFFLILNGPSCLKLVQKTYCIPQIILFVLVVIFNVVKPPRPPKIKQEGQLSNEEAKKAN